MHVGSEVQIQAGSNKLCLIKSTESVTIGHCVDIIVDIVFNVGYHVNVNDRYK